MAFQIILQETNDYLDLKADTDIAKTAGWFDLRDLAARSGEYTNTFTIPASSKNKKALKLDMPAPDNSLAYAKVPVLITENGLPFLQGFLQIISDEVDIDAGKYEITVSVQGNYTDWLNTVSEAELKDLPALNHNFFYPQVHNVENPNGTVNLLLSDGGVMQYNTLYLSSCDFTPAIPLKKVLTDIFNAAGYKVVFPNFISSSAFNTAAIPIIDREQYSDEFVNNRKSLLKLLTGGAGNNFPLATQFMAVNWATDIIDQEIIQGNDNAYGASGTAPELYWGFGGIEVDVQIKMNVFINFGGINTRICDVVLFYDGTFGQRQIIRLASLLLTGNNTTTGEDINQTYRLVIPANQGLGLAFNQTQGYIPGNDVGIDQDADGDCFIKITPTGRSHKFENCPYIFANGITQTNNLYNRIDLKQRDVIKYACVAFGMYPVTEGDTVTFKLLDSAINNSEPKLDISKFINLNKYNRSFDLPQAQQNLYQYDNDTSDTYLSEVSPITTLAEGNVISNNMTLPKTKDVYQAPFSYSTSTATIPFRNWNNTTRPFKGFNIPMMVIGKYKPNYALVVDGANQRYARYEPYNNTNGARYYPNDIIMFGGNYLKCKVDTGGSGVVDPRVINAGGNWEIVDYDSINEGGSSSKPRICLYATVDLAFEFYLAVYGGGNTGFISRTYAALAFTNSNLFQDYNLYTGLGAVPVASDTASLSFQDLINSFSQIIVSSYAYSEVYRLEARLTNTQVDELLNSTGLFINVGNQTLKLTGVFWLNTIDQFRGSGKPVIIELVRL